MRKKNNCDWCSYPTEMTIHSQCAKKPDYHDHEAYWNWMFDPARPSSDKSRKRKLTPEQERWLHNISGRREMRSIQDGGLTGYFYEMDRLEELKSDSVK